MTIPAKLTLTRRNFLKGTIAAGGTLAPFSGWSESNTVNLSLPIGLTQRELTVAFPQKAAMILQRTRPPLLETPFEVFDRGVFTPNDQFFVRWHWAVIPQQIDVTTFRLAIRGHVNNELSLSLADIVAMPRVELVAVNQCSGNSRGFFQPRVAGGQWSNGAMGNARTGLPHERRATATAQRLSGARNRARMVFDLLG
jgi:DMSO/TMAO reductase YedYZ molybdopterin-dependent catalytic subunit